MKRLVVWMKFWFWYAMQNYSLRWLPSHILMFNKSSSVFAPSKDINFSSFLLFVKISPQRQIIFVHFFRYFIKTIDLKMISSYTILEKTTSQYLFFRVVEIAALWLFLFLSYCKNGHGHYHFLQTMLWVRLYLFLKSNVLNISQKLLVRENAPPPFFETIFSKFSTRCTILKFSLINYRIENNWFEKHNFSIWRLNFFV